MTRVFMRRGGALLAGAAFAFFSLVLFACASGESPKPATEVTAETQSSRPTVLPAVAAPVSVLSMRLSDAVGDDARKEVRVVDKPTLAALDFAAYYDNPIRLAGKDEKPENYKGLMANAKLAEYPFPMLDSLSEFEPAVVAGRQPLAWEPFPRFSMRRLETIRLRRCSALWRRSSGENLMFSAHSRR